MRYRIIWVMLLLAIVAVFSACGGKYSDAIEVNKKFADATESYVETLAEADSASTVADAVNAYAAKIEKLAPQMKQMVKKYPELKDQTNMPDELKESRERSEALGEKMTGAMMKSLQYMGDPEVMKAQERLQKSMMLMAQ
ncbi:MAG: hypothetical protein HKM93_17995 [Desulfobacteraceae bacterium]|nr:hypothetical protein [Desulfobacteraceae bacterium]